MSITVLSNLIIGNNKVLSWRRRMNIFSYKQQPVDVWVSRFLIRLFISRVGWVLHIQQINTHRHARTLREEIGALFGKKIPRFPRAALEMTMFLLFFLCLLATWSNSTVGEASPHGIFSPFCTVLPTLKVRPSPSHSQWAPSMPMWWAGQSNRPIA